MGNSGTGEGYDVTKKQALVGIFHGGWVKLAIHKVGRRKPADVDYQFFFSGSFNGERRPTEWLANQHAVRNGR